MALVLQLATLLLATTAFATPCTPGSALKPDIDPGFPNYQLSFVSLGVGTQSFVCNTDSGAYESASYYLEIYDASCLNSTSYLDGIEAVAQDYVSDHPDLSVFDLNEYIKETYDLDNYGQFLTTKDNRIELSISEDQLNGDVPNPVYLDVTSQGSGWAKLTSNNDGGVLQVFFVENYPPSPSSSCGTGSSDLTFQIAAELFGYTTSDNN